MLWQWRLFTTWELEQSLAGSCFDGLEEYYEDIRRREIVLLSRTLGLGGLLDS